MPVLDEDTRLKKTALLRTIENAISDASVTERILELMEFIEELDKREGISASKSMKDAYCAVAVECSVKYFLVGKFDKQGKCVSAMNEIWRRRVTAMRNSGKSELVTTDLKEWMDSVEEALWDASARKKLTNMNTRNDALRSVLKYLGEAWAMLGPSFLQLNATLIDREQKKLSCNDFPVKARGKKVSFDVDEGGIDRPELAISTENPAETRESVSKISDEIEMRTENLLNVIQDAGGNDLSDLSVPAEKHENAAKVWDEIEIVTENFPNVGQDVGESTRKAEMERTGVELENQTEVPGLIENVNERAVPMADHCPRIGGAVEMHKLVSKDEDESLQAMVKDPLPNALKVSEALLENLGTRKGDTASPSRSKPMEQNKTNAVANVNMASSCLNHDPRPNLMEGNSTACNFEWNDSGDSSPVEVENRNTLPPPISKKRAVSPLKKHKATKFAKRRKIRRWSPLEEDTLKTAVEKYGAGNWKLMWNCYSDIFEGRTEVDLKDKWRNMSKY